MTPTTLFYILIAILTLNYVIDAWVNFLNAKRFDDPVPDDLSDLYDHNEYLKSQEYKKTNARFSMISGLFFFGITLAFFFMEGFKFVDELTRTYTSNSIVVSLLFFGIIGLGLDLLSLPFSYYKTFVIEERFGFNKTTIKTFILDKLKSWVITIGIGGPILASLVWFYETAGTNFWIYAWILIAVFSVFMNLFYSKLIVPLFNKQTPLEDGALKTAIEGYAKKVGFTLDNIFVIDGSKRSTKANAYFSGFGNQKRITLYDTLINDLSEDEIVAVLAHEVGHYKKKHIVFNLIASVLLTGITLYVLSLLISSPLLSQSLGINQPSFHIGLIVFGVLYAPISEITGIFMNMMSRTFEYQADQYAKETYNGGDLINALKKLSKKSLSNLTPHPIYVFLNYSHPPLLARMRNLAP